MPYLTASSRGLQGRLLCIDAVGLQGRQRAVAAGAALPPVAPAGCKQGPAGRVHIHRLPNRFQTRARLEGPRTTTPPSSCPCPAAVTPAETPIALLDRQHALQPVPLRRRQRQPVGPFGRERPCPLRVSRVIETAYRCQSLACNPATALRHVEFAACHPRCPRCPAVDGRHRPQPVDL